MIKCEFDDTLDPPLPRPFTNGDQCFLAGDFLLRANAFHQGLFSADVAKAVLCAIPNIKNLQDSLWAQTPFHSREAETAKVWESWSPVFAKPWESLQFDAAYRPYSRSSLSLSTSLCSALPAHHTR